MSTASKIKAARKALFLYPKAEKFVFSARSPVGFFPNPDGAFDKELLVSFTKLAPPVRRRGEEIPIRVNLNLEEKVVEEQTPLMFAICEGKLEAVKELIDTGINYRDKYGWNALMLASLHGYFRIVDLLIREGANVNHTTRNGTTALMLSSVNENNQLVLTSLLKKGANMEATTDHGWTPLMYAAYNANPKGVKVLLTYGADKTVINKDNQNAVDCAKLAIAQAQERMNADCTKKREAVREIISLREVIAILEE